MKKIFLFLLASLVAVASFAQVSKIAPADLQVLKKKEDSLKVFAKDLFTKSNTGDRMRSDSMFIRTLVRSLQVKNSFYFPYDSIKGISKLYAPDSTFRIFTWQISFDNDYNYSRQRGAIQFRTKDGSLKLVPLKDYSEFAIDPLDSVRNKDSWIGAVYYNIVHTKHNGKNYYTLFGFDGNSYRSNKKWIEVLTFDERNMPVFGGKYFSFEKDSIKRPDQYRYSIEYKKEASTTLNYDPELKMILVDHLISEADEPESKWTYIPDGDYEGFKWENGKWVHVDKVFDYKLKDGQFPMPAPLRDPSGNFYDDSQKTSDKDKKAPAKKKGT